MDARDFSKVTPDIMLGEPAIEGTRIPVELVIRKLGEGATMVDLLDGYFSLSREKIRAALIYAADLIADERTVFLEKTTRAGAAGESEGGWFGKGSADH